MTNCYPMFSSNPNCNIEEGQEIKCIYCGGYAQFFHNRYSYSCFDCGNHWQPNEEEITKK